MGLFTHISSVSCQRVPFVDSITLETKVCFGKEFSRQKQLCFPGDLSLCSSVSHILYGPDQMMFLLHEAPCGQELDRIHLFYLSQCSPQIFIE